MSLRFSRRDMLSWPMLRTVAICSCVSFCAFRMSCKVSSSAINSCARASTFCWRAEGSLPMTLLSVRMLISYLPFFQRGFYLSQMIAESCVGYLDDVLVKPGLAFTFLVSPDKYNGLLNAVECKSEAPEPVVCTENLIRVED